MIGELIFEGRAFIEVPRWHEGSLWFCNFNGAGNAAVIKLNSEGKPETVIHPLESEGSDELHSGGIDWDAEGRLVLVKARTGRLIQFDNSFNIFREIQLSGYTGPLNDMVVSGNYSYVGACGHEATSIYPLLRLMLGFPLKLGSIRKVNLVTGVDMGSAADAMSFPNGSVFFNGGRRLVIAETFAKQLTAFDVDINTGDLSNREVWASTGSFVLPDGICFDSADGGIWVANSHPFSSVCCIKYHQGGKIEKQIKKQGGYVCYACGMDNSGNLYLLENTSFKRTGKSRIRKLLKEDLL